ncbi:hypothetical protein BKA63DRAFT_65980 [Paraphoma chrysanthemicola]|nr:hypothetical protein BKA63DRAFT_65980 [Paraphoma chrysanthemicola]
MRPSPMIFVREFDGAETSYRIPIRRARSYWEFLEHIHNTFNRPWERYNAHLHLDNNICDGRISPSEWDAGAYFEAEFLIDNRLVLFVHFEVVEARVTGLDADIDADDEEIWQWGWEGSEGLQDTWYRTNEDMDGDDLNEWDLDPYPPFPETLPEEDVNVSSIFTASVRSSQTSLPPKRAPTPEVITVDDSDTTKYLDTGIIIGRAKSHCCRDPNVRPVVRAVLNSKGSVCAFICAKYAKRSSQKGDVQISMKDVDYSPDLEESPFGEKRTMAIRHKLQAKLAIQRQCAGLSPSPLRNLLPAKVFGDATRTYQTVMDDGIIIGHARPDSCRYPDKPPIVRASLNRVGSVMAYIPAEDSLRPLTKGRAQIPLTKVSFVQEFEVLSPAKRPEAIKDIILAKAGEKPRESEEKQVDERGKDVEYDSDDWGDEKLVDVESA